MISLVLAAVAVAETARAANPEPVSFPVGRLVEHVACRSDPTQTYTLYLPPRYTPEKRWPALLVFDPRGRSMLAAELFRPAAEIYGWVILSSNDTRSDGPMEPNIKAVNALWPEVHLRYQVDDRRIYAAGFSGGAFVAWLLERQSKGLAGVIAASGRYETEFFDPQHLAPNFATAGDIDFNYQGTREVDRFFDKHGASHRLEIFAGPHRWMPPELALTAVEWMELGAIRAGLRPRDQALIDRLFAADLAASSGLAAQGRPLEAMRRYLAVASTFRGLHDVAEAKSRAATLEASVSVRNALDEEHRWDAFETSAKQREARVIGEIVAFEEPMPAGRIAHELDLERLQTLARGGGVGAVAARRVLESLFTQTSFYLTRDFLAGHHYVQAEAVLEVAVRIKPESATTWYNLACARSRLGHKADALEALSRAIDAGFSDRALVERDDDLDALRREPGFPAVVARMKR